MNKHYICTGGCGGVSEMPGVCQDPNCAKHGQPLMECKCGDGKHENGTCENCSKICNGTCDIEPAKPELN